MINSNEKKILVIDDFHPIFMELLGINNWQVDYKPNLSATEVLSHIKQYKIVAVRSKINFDKKLLQANTQLICIARGGAGMDNIDEMQAKTQNILLLNAPEGNRDAVAEHTLGLLLAVQNNLIKGHNEIKNLKWDREGNRGYELKGKTIGVIGYGNTGKEFVKRLIGFGVKILVFDKYKKLRKTKNIEPVSIEKLQANADIISLHIPLTDETRGWIGSEFINACKKNIVLINTSRGKIVKLGDVINALKNKKIASFVSDVLPNENMNNLTEVERAQLLELLQFKSVILTPHVAGWTYESYYKISKVLANKIIMNLG